jgi:pimeloyl-ACP methyl ester carboxylesterase
VARAVLVKVEGPDQTWMRPAATQRHLAQIHTRAAADPEVARHVPDFLGAVRTLLRRLERAPVTVTLPAAADSAHGASIGVDSLQVTVGAYDLRCALARALASTRQSAGLADFVYQLSRENWTPLAERALVERRGSLGSAMALMMDCASGATAERRRGIAAERADPANLLADALDAPFYPETCAACGHPDLGDAFRGPLQCAVPVLFVSGELDARTPPANVQEIRAGFTRSTHIRVTNAGHDSRELISEEYRGLLQAFLRGESVPDCTLELPFRFEPIRADTAEPGPLRVRGTGRAGGPAR